MTRTGPGASEVDEELIIDIERYKAHPSCDALVGLVFDPDRLIQNPLCPGGRRHAKDRWFGGAPLLRATGVQASNLSLRSRAY